MSSSIRLTEQVPVCRVTTTSVPTWSQGTGSRTATRGYDGNFTPGGTEGGVPGSPDESGVGRRTSPDLHSTPVRARQGTVRPPRPE